MSGQNPSPVNDVSVQKGRSRSGGRPEYKPTDEQRALVSRLVGENSTKAAIAKAVGVSRVTLRKHFAAELGVPAKEPPQPVLALDGAHAPAAPDGAPIGRPEFEPTYRQRDDVKLWKADDWSDERIARALGVSRTTLLKHFAEELDYGIDQVRTRNLRNLQRAADALSVPAIREVLQLKGMLAPAQQLPVPEASREPAIGKKEQANRDAQTAHEGTSWSHILN